MLIFVESLDASDGESHGGGSRSDVAGLGDNNEELSEGSPVEDGAASTLGAVVDFFVRPRSDGEGGPDGEGREFDCEGHFRGGVEA